MSSLDAVGSQAPNGGVEGNESRPPNTEKFLSDLEAFGQGCIMDFGPYILATEFLVMYPQYKIREDAKSAALDWFKKRCDAWEAEQWERNGEKDVDVNRVKEDLIELTRGTMYFKGCDLYQRFCEVYPHYRWNHKARAVVLEWHANRLAPVGRERGDGDGFDLEVLKLRLWDFMEKRVIRRSRRELVQDFRRLHPEYKGMDAGVAIFQALDDWEDQESA